MRKIKSGKTTLMNKRVPKPANRSGMQQEFVPGSSGGKGHYKKMDNGRGKSL
jgi:hypothetical protein